MYINRALLALLVLFLVFLPLIDHWVWQTDSAWYRPYLLWLAAVLAAWWNQRSRYRNEF